MKYLKNTSWLLGEKVLRMTVGLFVGVWVARYLGPEQFGVFSYAQSFVGLFTTIATLGLDGIVVRELVKDDSKTGELIATSFYLKLIGACLVLGVLAIAVNFTSNDHYTNVLVFIIASSTILQSFNVIDFYFQAKVLSRFVVFANVFSLLLSSVLKIILILNEAPLVAFAWVVLFDSAILALGLVCFFAKEKVYDSHNFCFKKDIAVILLKDSWPLILGGIAVSFYMKIDQVMIKEMLTTEDVGQYGVAVRLSEIWCFLYVIITASLFPAIINAKNKSERAYMERLQKLHNLLILMSIIVALFMSVFSLDVVTALYGEAFKFAASVLAIHIWAGLFVALGMASDKFLVTENMQWRSFFRTFSGAMINIFLNLMLIPKYGIEGAAIATLISYAFAGYFYDMFDPKCRDMFVIKTKALCGFWRLV